MNTFRKSLFILFFGLLTKLSAETEDVPVSETQCAHIFDSQSKRITARHIEANGIGYHQGYSTLEGFFAPTAPWHGFWIPFLDIRGHVFNNAKFAANAGVGLRFLSSRIWGTNIYYDYRNTHHRHYNQVAVGFESLGKVWDFRLNGYLPVGKNKTSIFHTRFNAFKNHYMILKSKREYAMRGLNAEVGVHVDNIKNTPFYFAGGPYLLHDKKETAWGGELRAVIDLFDCARIEGSASYDHRFKWISQGQLSLIFPFGGKKKKKTCPVSKDALLLKRMIQRVDRHEIIPIDKKHSKSKAINPFTGKPYFFWFVDNTSHSDGTFESPFATLIAAQNASSPNDIIYVFPGDGTTKGMNQGFVMQDNQKILGSGIQYDFSTTRGLITVPAQTETFPLITNQVFETAAITLANSCRVEGLHITATNGGDGILGGDPDPFGPTIVGISNTVIKSNIITDSNVTNGAIYLANCRGELIVSNNSISNITSSNFPAGIDVLHQVVPADVSVILTNNTISHAGLFGAVVQTFSPSGQINCVAENNFITNCDSGMLLAALDGLPGVTMCGNIRKNTIKNSVNNGFTISTSNVDTINAEISENTFIANAPVGFEAHSFNVSKICAKLINNTSDNGFNFVQFDSSVLNAASPDGTLSGIESSNIGSINISGTVNIVSTNACACP